METETSSSKYDDIICKTLISSGSPSVYQLTAKEQNIGTIQKYILGEPKFNKTNKTVLLVGETGSGKSELINALVNYAIGVTWEDNIYFKIVNDKIQSQAQSHNNDVIVYQIFGFEEKTLPYSLTIIDTPGFGSTQGPEHDMKVRQRLFDLFRSAEGVHEIHTVGLVMKSTECRLNDRQAYVFNSVMSLFGKDIQKNVVILMTYSNGAEPDNALNALKEAKVKCATDDKNQPVYFLFDNCWHKNRNKDIRTLKFAYDTSREGLEGFTEFLSKSPPQTLKTTVEVMKTRIRLTACINNLKEKIEFIELQQRVIEQMKEGLSEHQQEMEMNKNFTVEVDEVYKEKVQINGWPFFNRATCCTVCEENCHFPGCTLAISPSWCEVMVNGHCTACTNKCKVSDHVRENWYYKTKTRRVTKADEEMKEKYLKTITDKENKNSLLEHLQNELETLKAQKTKFLEESAQLISLLEEIALSIDSMSMFIDSDFLIQKLEEKKDQFMNSKAIKILKRMQNHDQGGWKALWRSMRTGSGV